ncbi:MAG: endolytic transglycosylase MltG [Fibrobacterota bacterium]
MQKKKLFPVIVITLLLVGAGLWLYYGEYYPPQNNQGKPVRITIERGTSLQSISHLLARNNIIQSHTLFYYYMRWRKEGHKIQAGAYMIPQQAGLRRAAEILISSPLVEGVNITIPEGLTRAQTATVIAHQYPLDSAVFDSLTRDSTMLQEVGKDDYSSLEGFLYPESYLLPKKASEKDVIAILVRQFDRMYASLEMTEKKADLSTYEALILASIIEKETRVPHELRRISAVFHNRLEKGIPLGADATVRYALDKFTSPLRVSELKSDTPYNTRRFAGLPPTPICSPGKEALLAAYDPLDTDELFFVAKWDGSGEHYFSRTNAEHNRKKMEIRRKNPEIGNW